MPRWSFPLDELVPHRPPMRLVDAVEEFDPERRTARVSLTVRPEWAASHVAIEFMAQAAATLAGLLDRQQLGPGVPPKPGFLLGTRRLELRVPRFEPGERLLVRVESVFCDDESASFACEVVRPESGADGEVVARATLNAYRPADAAGFLASMKGANGTHDQGN